MATYATLNDAIHYEIITPLGEWAHRFNINAIAERLIYWYHDINADGTIKSTAAASEYAPTLTSGN